ncbi:MAG: hypothetical protein HW412_2201, partial [Bacteroidetes bacterium]|nr:hypothetical protein [Bacteroidota bacterium]
MKPFKMFSLVPGFFGCAILTFTSHILYEAVDLLSPSQQHQAPHKPFSDRQSAIEDRWQFEFDMLKDPRTGRIPIGIRDREIALARTLPTREDVRALRGDILNTYTVLGPGNLGGRTRAFAYDKLSASIMLSGGVSSGIFRSTNGGASWTNVTPADEIHNVTALAQDPRAGFESTWYYATGESFGNSASLPGSFYFGHGMYKSTDNGLTWSKLTAYNTGTLEGFDSRRDFCHRIAINPTTGHIYAAVTNNIVRSTDGGTTWTGTPGVLGKSGSFSSAEVTDIICTSTGRLYAAFSGIAGNSTPTGTPPSTDLDGVWTSTTGAALSWTKIAGSGSATTPPGWNAAGIYRRVVLALAPSNEDILYVLYDNLVVSDCAGVPAPEADFFKWVQSTSTWTDRSANMPNEPGCSNGNDPFAIQGGYDIAIAVKPDDENFVLIGGTNAYRSTDGFATTTATTRIGGYAGTGGYTEYTGHHPDIHVFRFHPTTPTTMVCGSDGGIHRTTGIAA